MSTKKIKGSTRLLPILGMLVLAWSTSIRPAAGDGLLFKLPADGTSAIYDTVMDGDGVEAKGTLSVSSVGKAGSGDEASRWIEFEMTISRNDRQQIIRAKLLIPEKNLVRGESGFAHIVKAYQKHGERDVEAIDLKNPRNIGPLPAFLAGPLKAQKDLPAVEVNSGLGKLQCAGVSGSLVINEDSAVINVKMEHRLHEKAPFGVVSSTMKFEVNSDGERRQGGTVRLTLAKVGKGAKSTLPDSN